MKNFDEIYNFALNEWQKLETCGKPRILIGAGTCGRAAGALDVKEAVLTALKTHSIDANIIEVGCLGPCYAEPIMGIIKSDNVQILYANLTPELSAEIVTDYLINNNPHSEIALGYIGNKGLDNIPNLFSLPFFKPQVRIVLRNCGLIDPQNINDYIANGGYSGFVKALSMKPEEVIDEIKRSGLRGRGGAGFPTGQKWEFCRKSKGTEKYIICNADEGDPGAFMNRSLIEGDPHSLLEGMLIGAYAIGASEGYIYCRAEYPLALQRLEIAIKQMTEYNLLGEKILGTDFNFHLHIKEGAGAFVCGEETALMASIEGKRGMPRARPPFPAVSGLWAKPTNINNVETWVNAAVIMQKGSKWYSQFGTENSSGTKTFALVGKVERTGLIEVPFGIKLKEIIFDIGGGIVNKMDFKAVQTGGPSGGCLPKTLLELPVDYKSLTEAGSIMGSGGMIVADETTCIVDLAKYFLTFIQAESCGKCVPCRVGTNQMLRILEKITLGEGELNDIDELLRLADTIKNGALCGLGQTAPNPALTSLKYFKSEFEEHIINKRCPALKCKNLITFYILPDKCQGCGICSRNCPVGAITGGKRMVHIIDQIKCIKCGTCVELCPTKFSAAVKVSGEKIEVPKQPIPIKEEGL